MKQRSRQASGATDEPGSTDEPEPEPAEGVVVHMEVNIDAVVDLDITDEQKESLISAAESVAMKADTPEEQAVQEAALNDALSNISEEEQQAEYRGALEALQAYGLALTEDGALPEGVEVEVKREVFMQVEPKGYSEEAIDGVVKKSLSLEIAPFYNLLASVKSADGSVNADGVKVGESKPATMNKPIQLSVELPDGFTDANYVFVHHSHDGNEYTYRGEIGFTPEGNSSMSFVSLGLSPFEITNAADMAAKIAADADGTTVDLYYATLQEAVEAVENGGAITLVKPVTEDIASIKDKVCTVKLDDGVNADDVKLTLDGRSVTFQNGEAVIEAEPEVEYPSEALDTNQQLNEYVGEHIKITAVDKGDDDGLYLSTTKSCTIQTLNGERIQKIVMTIGHYGGSGYPYDIVSDHGTLADVHDYKGSSFSYINVNSPSATIISQSRESVIQVKRVVVYYAIDVTGVSLNQAATAVGIGGATALTVAIAPEDATDKYVKWSVDNDKLTLYSDEDCTTEVGPYATSALTVYAKGMDLGAATVTVTSHYDSEKSASRAVTVKRPIAIAPADKEITYSAEEIDLSASGLFDIPAEAGEAAYAVGNGTGAGTVTDGKLTVTKSGAIAVTVNTAETDDSMAGTATATLTVAKANLTPSVALDGWTYGETANSPSVTGNDGNGAVTYAYTVKGGDEFSETVPSAVGEYTVKATIAETDNYNGGEATADFAISKANLTPSVTLDGWTYGETANSPSVTGNDGNGAVAYSYAVKGSDEFAADIPTDAGEYTVRATIAETDNYNGGEAVADFAISKANLTPTVSMEGWTYGETANSPSVEGNAGNGAVTYAYKLRIAEDEAYDSAVPTDAGEYTVRATIAETDNYNGGETVANFTIMPSTPDEPATPDEPSTPDEPATPDEPSTPDEPATPDEPSTPDEPTTPDEPSTPDEPATPDEPSTPDEPMTPDEPATPDEPSTPETVFTVIWLNGNGTELDRQTYAPGQDEPTTVKIPVKRPDDVNVYEFSKWDDGVMQGDVKTYTPEFTATPFYTVVWLNGDGTELDRQIYTDGQNEPKTAKAPIKKSDDQNVYTFTGWNDGQTEGKVKTYMPNFIAVAKKAEVQPAAEEVRESPAEVGETQVVAVAIETLNIPEEQKQNLIAAVESVGMKADTAEEKAVQEAALNNAVDNIPEEEKQAENQVALNTLLQLSGLTLTDDGQLPEDVKVEVKREIFTQVEAKDYSERIVDGVPQKSLSLDINALYNTVASLTNDSDPGMNMSGVTVGEPKPASVEKPISLSVNLPADFTDAAHVFINHVHGGKTYTYRGELGDAEDGQRSMSFVSIGLSPFEITNATSMAAKFAVDADGVAVDVYYATLQDAVQDVENNGVITLMEPVTEAIASEKGKGYTVELASGVSADDVTLTLDGKAVTFKDGKAVILAADESADNNPGGDTPSDADTATSGGCYVATSVYGSYDCPEVWTLRRFRDEVLAETWYGRLFIRLYYTVSPTAVKWFGNCEWFQNFFRDRLDKMVSGLQADGFESTPYQDLEW